MMKMIYFTISHVSGTKISKIPYVHPYDKGTTRITEKVSLDIFIHCIISFVFFQHDNVHIHVASLFVGAITSYLWMQLIGCVD